MIRDAQNSAVIDYAATKLHVADNGHVWYLHGNEVPVCTEMSVLEFIGSTPGRVIRKARVMGSKQNASLICNLHRRKNEHGYALKSVQVCTPQICPGSARKSKPAVLLYDLRRHKDYGPVSIGGWHETTAHDFVVYGLIMAVEKGDDKSIDMFLKEHPVYKAVQLIPHLDQKNLATLLASIIDPRWFVDKDEPNRLNRLYKFLGLDEKTQLAVHSQDTSPKMYARCKLVLDTWKTSSTPSNDKRSFLWRTWLMENDDVRSDLRASQKFIDYIFANWIEVLARQTPVKCAEPLFIPEYFFEAKEDVDAYKEHMSRQ